MFLRRCLIAVVSYKFGYRMIFAVAPVLAVPALLSLFRIDAKQIDYARSRGASDGEKPKAEGLRELLKDRVLLFSWQQHSYFTWQMRPCFPS